MEAIYSDLIASSISSSSPIFDKEDWGDFEQSVFENYLSNKLEYINLLKGYLKEGWEISRINKVALCILLEALSEFFVCKTPVGVLIQESVKTAKNYCGEDEYKFVNGILEKCFKEINR